jgi:hypothetical protein
VTTMRTMAAIPITSVVIQPADAAAGVMTDRHDETRSERDSGVTTQGSSRRLGLTTCSTAT